MRQRWRQPVRSGLRLGSGCLFRRYGMQGRRPRLRRRGRNPMLSELSSRTRAPVRVLGRPQGRGTRTVAGASSACLTSADRAEATSRPSGRSWPSTTAISLVPLSRRVSPTASPPRFAGTGRALPLTVVGQVPAPHLRRADRSPTLRTRRNPPRSRVSPKGARRAADSSSDHSNPNDFQAPVAMAARWLSPRPDASRSRRPDDRSCPR
jgi:hypothetical protein